MQQLYLVVAFKEKEAKKEEELQVHFDSCVDWRLHWQNDLLFYVPGACICPFRSSSLWRPRKQIWWHNPQFLMKGLTFIHSIIDRSSIVLVQIPLKTARFSSFFPDLSFICLAAQPLICSTPPSGSQTAKPFKLQIRKQLKLTRKETHFLVLIVCTQLKAYKPTVLNFEVLKRPENWDEVF